MSHSHMSLALLPGLLYLTINNPYRQLEKISSHIDPVTGVVGIALTTAPMGQKAQELIRDQFATI